MHCPVSNQPTILMNKNWTTKTEAFTWQPAGQIWPTQGCEMAREGTEAIASLLLRTEYIFNNNSNNARIRDPVTTTGYYDSVALANLYNSRQNY